MGGLRQLLWLLLASGLLLWPGNAACPNGCYCNQRNVRCMKSRLEAVPAVPNDTFTLDLRGNNIRDVPAGSLLHLRLLHSLLLNNNRLISIRSGAFAGLSDLKFLYLYKNSIRHIEQGAFRGLKKLEQLYLHANKIEDLQPDVFADLENLERLFLHSNNLKHLPGGVLSGNPKVMRVRLDNNPLDCDCKMLWLLLMVSKRSEQGNPLEISGLCHEPPNLKGVTINSIPYSDLHCDVPVIIEEPTDIIAEEGGKAMFTCKVFGNPRPSITWMRNSNEIDTDDWHFHVMDNGSLVVEHPEDVDDATYACMAKSAMGEAKSRPARMAMAEKVSYGYPVFSMKPHNIVAKLGTELIQLNCLAKAKPRPRVRWLRNNEPLLQNERVSVFNNGTLLISSPIESDNGVYTCYAENQHGTVSAKATVEIQGPPRFVERSPEKTARTGERVEFVCVAEGNPKPTITWYKDSQPFTSPSSMKASGSTKFIIESVQQSDQGIYVCTAENSEGFIEATTSLTVVRDFSGKPTLTIKPYDIDAVLGSSVEIPCRSDNSPNPTILWHKDGRALIPNERIKISTFGSIYIINVTQRDIGRYECSAVNQFGRDTASGLLTIMDIALPGDPFVTEALAEAMDEIDVAINKTLEKIFDTNRTEKLSTADLLKKIRFPNAPAREVAKAAEIYERTLVNIRKHVNRGEKVKATDTFDYKEILTPEHIDLVARLSGCTEHRRKPDCTNKCFHLKFRNIDGTCNNLKNPTWGASLTGFRRILAPIYENGFSQPVGWNKSIKYNGYSLPSARLVSSKLISTPVVTPDTEITHMVMQWGQFIDHDMDHSLPAVSSQSWDGIDCKKSCDYAAPCFPIEIPSNDTRVRNRRCLDFVRTSAVCGSGMTSVFFGEIQPREQVNQLTSFIDASQVYGYSDEIAETLRDLSSSDGLMRVGLTYPGSKPLLPFAAGNQGIDCRRNLTESSINCFAAGDIRVNEQVGLTAMHTLWMREHNRIAKKLKQLNPHWDGDKIFQEVRKIVGAMIQHITYAEWLPIILGKQGMQSLGNFSKYDQDLNPAISNVFATAAFRFGHSLINPVLERLDENFDVIRHGNLALHKAFFSPWRITDEGGIDPLIRGMFMTAAKLKKPTENLNTELTEKLFKPAHAVALDLAAINIQRSRDHAIPPYLKWRQYCNMPTVPTFDDLQYEITNAKVRKILKELYGSPENIDVWVGGILEDQLSGAKVGPLFQCILIEQFRRLRDGDRLFYENPGVFKPEQLNEIKKISLARVICDNGDNIDTITENVFLLPELQEGTIGCNSLPEIDWNEWQECSECFSKDTIKLTKKLEDVEKEMKEFTILMIEMKDRIKTLEERTRDDF